MAIMRWDLFSKIAYAIADEPTIRSDRDIYSNPI